VAKVSKDAHTKTRDAVPIETEGRATKQTSSQKRTKTESLKPEQITLKLSQPGFSPFLRAGLGGLAATLRAQALNQKGYKWPSPIQVGDGEAIVRANEIEFKFGPSGALKFFETLLSQTFRVEPPGVIRIPGTADAIASTVLHVAQQRAYKRTFLQHGSTTKYEGSETTFQYEVDDKTYRVAFKPCKSFAHQGAIDLIAKALEGKPTRMAGWVQPGASQRHVAYPETICDYQLSHAIAGIFSLVGCISILGAGGTGLLVIPTPTNLIEFARTRPSLTPRNAKDFTVSGIGDAALTMLLALKFESGVSGVGDISVTVFRTLAWASQQKSRSHTLAISQMDEAVLNRYEQLVTCLPNRLVTKADVADAEEDGDDFFVATSALRGFVADNMALNLRWYHGFATATTGGKQPRFIHYFRERNGGLGALYPEEKKGLVAMEEHLDAAELALVRSVHRAISQRFGQIAAESREVKATMFNRFDSEREKWRLAFAGAKTPEQIRWALADLWSRAGANLELKENWERVIPLLRADRWQTARDLALVALASYEGSQKEILLSEAASQESTK
jgi:CRISPR-associated protein Cas8a1/Csx13